MSDNWLQVNDYWQARKHGPRNYTARRNEAPGWPEQVRFYFSREALEQDFGQLRFDDE